MATQKNLKSKKVTAQKATPSKTASKKPAAKPVAKAKPAAKTISKAKPVTKAGQASKGKKAVPASKSSVKASAKPVVKKQSSAKSPAVKGKKAPVSKAKPVQAKTVKRLEPVKSAGKKATAVKGIKESPVSKTSVKKIAPPSKTSPVSKSGPVSKPAAPPVSKASSKGNLPAAKSSTPQMPVKSADKKPAIVSKAAPKSIEPLKPVAKTLPVKNTPAPTAKKNGHSAGSKASDATRPSMSSKPVAEKPSEQIKSKESQFRPSKSLNINSVKPNDRMAEKNVRPMAATALPEEPHKSRYNDKELEEFDLLIDQKLIVAREQLEFYLKQLEDMAENPDNKIKGLDDGLSTLESERVSSMAARQQKLIQHLENAKIRIKNKVYGICRETGKLISKERLRAVPHATLSIEAKQAQN